MLANYHIHTYRCHHASGTDEEYIQKAIAEGIKFLGFSDHAPYIYPQGYTSYYKMTPEESGEYFSSLNSLREKYKNEIEIHIGYEAEYYPELWNKTLDFWKTSNRPEYLILGQHFVTEEYIRKEDGLLHSASGTSKEAMLTRYVNTVIEGINTGCFTYIAHPDVINFKGNPDFYCAEMERLILAAKAKNIPLEINLLGMKEHRHYPAPLFWETASKHTPDVVIGCDAHNPVRVADKNEIADALRFADKYKLNPLDKIDLISPFQ